MGDAQGSSAPVTRAVLARLVACAALAVAAAAVARWGLGLAGLSHGAADLSAALLAVALVIGSVELLVLRRLRLLNAALRPVAGGDLFRSCRAARPTSWASSPTRSSPC
jgi:hypothetical protein